MPDMESIIETVTFIGYLNALAASMKNGIMPFSRVTFENDTAHEDVLVYVDDVSDPEVRGGMSENDIIKDMVVSDIHHAALHGWGEAFSALCGKKIDAKISCPDGVEADPHVCLTIEGDETVIVIEKGHWYAI